MSTSRPLIAHVIHRFAMGGMENGLVNLINGMDDRYAHAIVCLNGYSDFRTRLTRADVELHDLQKKPGKDPGHYLRLRRVLRRLGPAIVHTRNIGTIEAGVVARLSGVAAVLHGEHGYDVADLHGANRRYRTLRRICSPCIKKFICVSQQIAGWLHDQVGISRGKLLQIYNGVDSDQFNPTRRDQARDALRKAGVDADYVIGSVGRLESVKNPLAALDAFAAQCGRDENFAAAAALVYLGGGSLHDQLRAAVSRYGLDDRVHLLGRRDDVADLLAGFDVFVLPSLNEGISNTILEAMASGVPVIASRVGGNPELVADGVTGRLYDCEDMQALAAWFGRYWRAADERESHAAAARSRALEKFSLQRMIKCYEDVYAEYC